MPFLQSTICVYIVNKIQPKANNSFTFINQLFANCLFNQRSTWTLILIDTHQNGLRSRQRTPKHASQAQACRHTAGRPTSIINSNFSCRFYHFHSTACPQHHIFSAPNATINDRNGDANDRIYRCCCRHKHPFGAIQSAQSPSGQSSYTAQQHGEHQFAALVGAKYTGTHAAESFGSRNANDAITTSFIARQQRHRQSTSNPSTCSRQF